VGHVGNQHFVKGFFEVVGALLVDDVEFWCKPV
jgi:hypothetical protein